MTTKLHTYHPLVPASSSPLPPSISHFFHSFYSTSDTPTAHGEYTTYFTPTATLVMGSRRGVGTSEIRAIREGMWASVASRLHTPVKIFPFGTGEGGKEEVMLHGTVAYVLKDGRKAEVDWAARAELVKNEEAEWKMSFYQVYLDTAAMQNAK